MHDGVDTSYLMDNTSAVASSRAILFATLEQLKDASDTEFVRGYPELVVAAERDFHDEEMLLEQADVHMFRNHMEQHARALSALHHVAPRVQEGDIGAGREAVTLLAAWLPLHMATTDAALQMHGIGAWRRHVHDRFGSRMLS